jgi:sortase A
MQNFEKTCLQNITLENNKYMNQILFNKKSNKRLKYIFKVQFIISIIVAFILCINIISSYGKEESLEKISKTIYKNLNLISMYESSNNENTYLGKIYIEKLNLEYVIFNTFNEELLKIAPCKFYGGNLGEKGNICIAGHNYNDNRFFGRLDELNENDIIKLYDLENVEYNFIVYDKFETKDDDTSILFSNKPYELTLLTCNNSNKKRIIVKAYMKEY